MSSVSTRTPNGRILIVDDNQLGLIARKSVLQELGYEIIVCLEPDEALKLCAEQKFDLIVTDFKMPGMNGIQFIRELREQSGNVPVILISGFVDTLGLTEATTGADAVVQKSANEVSHLIRSVNRLLRKPAKKPPASHLRPRIAKANG